MINNNINNIPKNTIAIFNDVADFPKANIKSIMSRSPKKRNWFTPHFYRCLPLTIGNQYGFIIKSEYDIEFEWDGSENSDGVRFFFTDEEIEKNKTLHPRIESWFGSGIITITMPFSLRTPPGVNIITINPPNFILPNITVMTGVIETDNLRRDFTFNLKVQIPNLRVRIPAGTPLAGFIPIPRYFQDTFKLVDAESIFSEEVFIEEYQAKVDALIKRTDFEYYNNPRVGRDYLLGKDIYQNNFEDHQITMKEE